MKKILVGVGVLALVVFAFSLAQAQFGGITKKIPGSGDVQKALMDDCRNKASFYRNNQSFNSSSLPTELQKNSDFSLYKVTTDWKTGGTNYEKKNKIYDAQWSYKNACYMRVRCNDRKCSTVNCREKPY